MAAGDSSFVPFGVGVAQISVRVVLALCAGLPIRPHCMPTQPRPAKLPSSRLLSSHFSVGPSDLGLLPSWLWALCLLCPSRHCGCLSPASSMG